MNSRKNIKYFICLCAVVCTLLVSVGISYARYQTSISKTLTFETKEIDSLGKIYITSEDGWIASGDKLNLEFTLSGEDKENSERKAYVRLTATEKFNPEAVVTLTVDDTVYEAKPHSNSLGELLYSQMGKGTEFRFYKDDNEVYWDLSQNKTMQLSIEGVADEALVRLVAKEK